MIFEYGIGELYLFNEYLLMILVISIVGRKYVSKNMVKGMGRWFSGYEYVLFLDLYIKRLLIILFLGD